MTACSATPIATLASVVKLWFFLYINTYIRTYIHTYIHTYDRLQRHIKYDISVSSVTVVFSLHICIHANTNTPAAPDQILN